MQPNTGDQRIVGRTNGVMAGRIVHLDHAIEVYGAENQLVQVCTISPADASAWLKANTRNRPLRKRHIAFLAHQMRAGKWELNGEPIIIGSNEEVLNGQHRLQAVIDSGVTIRSYVVYGISESAFATMDTGAVRSGADALSLHFREQPQSIVKTVATAVQWVAALQRRQVYSGGSRLSNAEVLEFAKRTPSLFMHAETLQGFAKSSRPLYLGVGTALYEIFARKDESQADEFMRNLYTGENLDHDDVELVLRDAFQKDAMRISTKLRIGAKVRMTVKAWNWRRRGMMNASHQVIALSSKDSSELLVL